MTAIILLLVLILLCMFKTVRIFIGLDARRPLGLQREAQASEN